MSKFYYLIKIQFIGFRFSGWQKQTNAKTIQEMFDRTVTFITGHEKHKTLAAGRTDAKVSTNEFALELFIDSKLETRTFLQELNLNLPPDIRALEVTEVDEKFNIMNAPKLKEYLYLFSYGERPHPFSAPFMTSFEGSLDIDLMKKGAKLFEGEHNFKNFCYKPSAEGLFLREIKYCELKKNDIYTASFFPEKSWALHIHGAGFMRNQIRLMMGSLVLLGQGKIKLEDISESLNGEALDIEVSFKAAASGLMLNRVRFDLIIKKGPPQNNEDFAALD